MIKEFLKAVKKRQGMDFVANEGYKFTKEELIDLLKEAMYVLQDVHAPSQLTDQFIEGVKEYVI